MLYAPGAILPALYTMHHALCALRYALCAMRSGVGEVKIFGKSAMSREPIENYSPAGAWLLATRPKTLPAAVAPVMVGSAQAYADQDFALLPALAALAVALLLQIAVNLANDYFDFKKGIDTDDRLGPARVTQSGLIAPNRVKFAMSTTLVLSLLPGIYLAARGGWPVIIIGGASIMAALAYSGGPYPLASHALGDLFVFIFFGLVAVCGTYYVQALNLTADLLLMGSMVGLMITAILVVNNLRDIQTDQWADKRTLAVILGARGTKMEYSLLHAGAYLLPIIIWISDQADGFILFPLLSLPWAIPLNRAIWTNPAGASLNQTLAGTARLALLFSLSLSIGLLLP